MPWPEWIDEMTLGDMLRPWLWIGVLLVAAGSYFKFVHPIVTKILQFLDDWAGRPARPGFEAVPGFPERVARMEKRLKRIEDHMCIDPDPDPGSAD